MEGSFETHDGVSRRSGDVQGPLPLAATLSEQQYDLDGFGGSTEELKLLWDETTDIPDRLSGIVSMQKMKDSIGHVFDNCGRTQGQRDRRMIEHGRRFGHKPERRVDQQR